MSEDRMASAEDWATVEFEPWASKEDAWQPPTNEQWCNPTAIVLRLAWTLMFKSKQELIAKWREDPDCCQAARRAGRSGRGAQGRTWGAHDRLGAAHRFW
jgi:hypothetical protein